jgi:hypothetical protein
MAALEAFKPAICFIQCVIKVSSPNGCWWRDFFLEIRKYKLQRLTILISQEKLPLNAVCLLRKYVDRRFFYYNGRGYTKQEVCG